MTLEEVMQRYGGKEASARKVADALGMTSACVYGWKSKGYVPYQSQLVIQMHSKGRMKADKKHDFTLSPEQ